MDFQNPFYKYSIVQSMQVCFTLKTYFSSSKYGPSTMVSIPWMETCAPLPIEGVTFPTLER